MILEAIIACGGSFNIKDVGYEVYTNLTVTIDINIEV